MTTGPHHHNLFKSPDKVGGRKTYLEKELEKWVGCNDSYTIKKVREFAGLPPIEYGDSSCKRCGKTYRTQFINKRKVEWFCQPCHYDNERTGQMDSFSLGRK